TGMALKSGISTGGLDILGIVVRKKTGVNYGKFNILVNLIIVLIAGFLFDWSRALYTVLNIFINGRFIDSVYTQHNKLQVMIVTEHPNAIIEGIQEKMHRGITIFHDVEGAYGHTEKTVLLTIIDTYDLYDIRTTVEKCDPFAFMGVTEVQKVYGRFREQEVV
ncbi:MAG: YitT family protein, partial [Lactobacillus delbrueckii]